MLNIDQLPIKRQGLTEFTYTRYLVPWLCDYQGEALFLDADMLCLTDIHAIKMTQERYSAGDPVEYYDGLTGRWPLGRMLAGVSVVKDDVEQFEWPSLMYFNCKGCADLTPEWIDDEDNSPQKWVFDNAGSIDKNWNHIVPYSGKNSGAKIVHYTQGIPCWEETRDCEYGDEWIAEFQDMCSSVTFEELMGTSVHKQRMGL